MKILFVTPWVPSSLRARSLGILKILAENNEIRILSLYRNDEELADGANLLNRWPSEFVANSVPSSFARCSIALAKNGSLQRAYANVAELRQRLAATRHEWRPDVVHLNVFRGAALADCVPLGELVIDLDEFRSDYYAQLARTGSFSQRLLGRWEAPRMRREEELLVNRGVRILVSGDRELQAGRSNVHLVRSPIPDPLDDVFERRSSRLVNYAAPVLLFVGRLTYEANVEAVNWFVSSVWPDLRSNFPHAELRIVGSQPPDKIGQLSLRDGIRVVPNAEDLRPHYEAADCAIVPVRRATGVQLKLIQAMSAGVPVVATPTVASAASVVHGRDLLVADAASDWVREITLLLSDRKYATNLSNAGRRWFVKNHSNSAVRGQLADAYISPDLS